ncbi:MAG: hypothetical protein JSS04_05490 [Proteobacteria bacterium]|nr:hypothetical protein [Pseudomonadota bacterium]
MLGRWLSSSKSDWLVLAQFAAWASATIGVFLVDPPQLWEDSGSDTILMFARFLTVILLGLVIFVAAKWNTLRYAKRWALFTVLTTIVAAGLFFSYRYTYANWTCPYVDDGRPPKVIGIHMSADAVHMLGVNHLWTCKELIQSVIGRTQKIWPPDEIEQRYFIFLFIYTATTLLFCAAILGLLQTLRCAGIADNRR